jgi:hypothetical protein
VLQAFQSSTILIQPAQVECNSTALDTSQITVSTILIVGDGCKLSKGKYVFSLASCVTSFIGNANFQHSKDISTHDPASWDNYA